MPYARLRDALRGAPAFLAVGVAGLSLDTAAFAALAGLGLEPAAARAGSLAAATLLTWRLNRRWSFAARGSGDGAELGRYAVVALLAQGFSFLVFLLGVEAGVPPLPALWTGAVLAAGAAFAGQRLFTFRAEPA